MKGLCVKNSFCVPLIKNRLLCLTYTIVLYISARAICATLGGFKSTIVYSRVDFYEFGVPAGSISNIISPYDLQDLLASQICITEAAYEMAGIRYRRFDTKVLENHAQNSNKINKKRRVTRLPDLS